MSPLDDQAAPFMPRRVKTLRATLLLSMGLLALPSQSVAQSITVDSLDAPKAFTPGISIEGALSAESWQGTSADRAIRLIEAMPVDTQHPIVRDMMRRVILSGLVLPQGGGADYDKARIAAAQRLASPEEYEQFAARNPAARDPRLRADAFIAEGDLASACEISDALQEGRGQSDWIRLRAACHDLRDETSLADLARDILRDRGEPTDLVVPDPPQDFWVRAMALDGPALTKMMTELAGEPDLILEVPTEMDLALEDIGTQANDPMSAPSLSDDTLAETNPQPTPLFPSSDPLIQDPLVPATPAPEPIMTYDLDAALMDESDAATARLFLLGRDGDARSVSAFVRRAVEAGLDANTVLPRIPAVLDPTDMAQVDLPLFARYAAMTRDIALMQALFIATEDEAAKERLALASDALGGGYIGRSLGEGLETALSKGAAGARKDVLMALALGANLEEETESLLADLASSQAPAVGWVALDQAIDRGTRAETLLRLADVLDRRAEGDTVTLYRVLRKLRNAGLADTAGQLAAYEYLRDL